MDVAQAKNFKDLPDLLYPNTNGLSQEQTRVYSEFNKLNARQRLDSISLAGLPQANAR